VGRTDPFHSCPVIYYFIYIPTAAAPFLRARAVSPLFLERTYCDTCLEIPATWAVSLPLPGATAGAIAGRRANGTPLSALSHYARPAYTVVYNGVNLNRAFARWYTIHSARRHLPTCDACLPHSSALPIFSNLLPAVWFWTPVAAYAYYTTRATMDVRRTGVALPLPSAHLSSSPSHPALRNLHHHTSSSLSDKRRSSAHLSARLLGPAMARPRRFACAAKTRLDARTDAPWRYSPRRTRSIARTALRAQKKTHCWRGTRAHRYYLYATPRTHTRTCRCARAPSPLRASPLLRAPSPCH